jgi:hypothetical protein
MRSRRQQLAVVAERGLPGWQRCRGASAGASVETSHRSRLGPWLGPAQVPLASQRLSGLKRKVRSSLLPSGTIVSGGLSRSPRLQRLIRPCSRLFAANQRPSGLNAIEFATPGRASMRLGARGSCVDHSASRPSPSLEEAIHRPSALTAMPITSGPTGARNTSGSSPGSGRRHRRAGSPRPQLSKWSGPAPGEKRSASIFRSCPRNGVWRSPGCARSLRSMLPSSAPLASQRPPPSNWTAVTGPTAPSACFGG